MTRLVAHEHTQVPADVAESFVQQYFQTLEKGRTATVRLRVPSADFGIGGGIAFEKDVRATLDSRLDPTHRNRIMTIRWEPGAGEPFPVFEGTLAAVADDSGEGSLLVLSGSYEAPGGVIGKVVDSTIGFWIARATVRDFLVQLRDGVERLYGQRPAEPASV